VADRVIENPIINSPYRAPDRHFAFDLNGITNEVVPGRRPSSYFVPVPRPRKRGQQMELEFAEYTADQIRPNDFVNQVRQQVELWRNQGRPHVTYTTRRLLDHLTDPQRDDPVLFCQLEAAETAIYLAEAAPKAGDMWIRNALAEANAEHNAGLDRIALKMATGSGKTVVMAMVIAWQTLNKVASPNDARFARRFLIITPGLTIRDRLRVLLPEEGDNYYKLRGLVPADLRADLSQARIVITNFHALQRRETTQGGANLTKALLAGSSGASPFRESWSQMVTRVCKDLGGTSGVVVFDDEAHHCYRGKFDDPEADAATEKTLTGDEKEEAKRNSRAARVWFNGLRAISEKLGVKAIYDLSATPSFLSGSGYREGTLFPWVVSDFALVEAIESGIVKIPRVPVDDNARTVNVTYLNLWSSIGHDLPKKSRKEGEVTPDQMPKILEGALNSLYDSYEKAFREWRESESARAGDPAPVFIVVCSNTTVSKMVYDYIAGWERTLGSGKEVLVPGQLGLFSNIQNDQWLPLPRTILVDSEQLESGEGLSAEYKKAAAAEIEEFKVEYARRFSGRSAADVDDAQILREVMNTVGKKDKLGEPVRCVVSVSMLTEGWDANTVTHILGVRAFGTQLLCEQVVGRGLRRRSYATDENGFFTPEYADVYGVPFQFIPTVAKTKDLKIKQTWNVHAEPDRAAARITFPKLAGYRIELPDEPLYAAFTDESRLALTLDDFATRTRVSGLTGKEAEHTLEKLRAMREQQVAYRLSHRVMELLDQGRDPRPWYFPQVLAITKAWLVQCVTYEPGTFLGLLGFAEYTDEAARKILHDSIRWQAGSRKRLILPMFRQGDLTGSTDQVDFFTTRDVFPTDAGRCHLNFVVLDGPVGNTWESAMAQVLETMPQVAAYVKNDHLGFAIPYTIQGRGHDYYPDFLVRLRPRDDEDLVRTLIVEVSGGLKKAGPTQEKAGTARDLWVPAVNNHGGFGVWGYCELRDPAAFRVGLEQAIEALYLGPLEFARERAAIDAGT
jgi:type III restriction enzyme